MKKIEILILTLILLWIIVWDILLYKVYNKIEQTRNSIIMENMYNKKDIISELQYMNSYLSM